MNVPLLDLKAQFATIKDEILPAMEAVMESQYFINGPEVNELEALVAEYSNTKAAVGVSSGTDALLASLKLFTTTSATRWPCELNSPR